MPVPGTVPIPEHATSLARGHSRINGSDFLVILILWSNTHRRINGRFRARCRFLRPVRHFRRWWPNDAGRRRSRSFSRAWVDKTVLDDLAIDTSSAIYARPSDSPTTRNNQARARMLPRRDLNQATYVHRPRSGMSLSVSYAARRAPQKSSACTSESACETRASPNSRCLTSTAITSAFAIASFRLTRENRG